MVVSLLSCGKNKVSTTMALIAVLVGIARADGERTEVAHTSAAGTDEVSKSSTPERTSP